MIIFSLFKITVLDNKVVTNGSVNDFFAKRHIICKSVLVFNNSLNLQ